MGKFRKASDEVVKIAEHVIDLYHEELKEARIGFLFRDEAPVKDGRITLGAAKKVGDEVKPYVNYDFLIWVAGDYWPRLDEKQKQALVDHELCHCGLLAGKPAMRDHDINEFACILERHGVWYPKFCYPERLEQAFQAALWKTGKVEAVDGDAFERTFRDAVTEAFAKDEKVSLEWVPATVRGEQ